MRLRDLLVEDHPLQAEHRVRLEQDKATSRKGNLRGRSLERAMERALRISGLFEIVVRHTPHSFMDAHGIDFSVQYKGTWYNFGVTRCESRARQCSVKYPDVPFFYVPYRTPLAVVVAFIQTSIQETRLSGLILVLASEITR